MATKSVPYANGFDIQLDSKPGSNIECLGPVVTGIGESLRSDECSTFLAATKIHDPHDRHPLYIEFRIVHS